MASCCPVVTQDGIFPSLIIHCALRLTTVRFTRVSHRAGRILFVIDQRRAMFRSVKHADVFQVSAPDGFIPSLIIVELGVAW